MRDKIRDELDAEKKAFTEEVSQTRKQIQKEKEAWNKEKEQVQSINSISDEIVQLNVSGVTNGFTVRKSLLCSKHGSSLQAMFSGRHSLNKIDGKIFMDRDPDVFRLLISYLRNNESISEIQDPFLRGQLRKELEFWMIIEKQKSLSEILVAFFNSEPTKSSEKILAQWRKLGPYDIKMNDFDEQYQIKGDLIVDENMEYFQVYKKDDTCGGVLKFKIGRLVSDVQIKEGNFGVFEDDEYLLNGVGRCISSYAVEQGNFKEGLLNGMGARMNLSNRQVYKGKFVDGICKENWSER